MINNLTTFNVELFTFIKANYYFSCQAMSESLGGKVVYSLAGRQACLHRKPGPRSAATPSTPSPAAGSGRSGT